MYFFFSGHPLLTLLLIVLYWFFCNVRCLCARVGQDGRGWGKENMKNGDL